jgi:hypothetical protein
MEMSRTEGILLLLSAGVGIGVRESIAATKPAEHVTQPNPEWRFSRRRWNLRYVTRGSSANHQTIPAARLVPRYEGLA